MVAPGRIVEGMKQQLEFVRRDCGFQDNIGRKTLLDVFNLPGGQGSWFQNIAGCCPVH